MLKTPHRNAPGVLLWSRQRWLEGEGGGLHSHAANAEHTRGTHHQWKADADRRPGGHAAPVGTARHRRSHRHQVRVWRRAVRRLHGSRGRVADTILLGHDRFSRREEDQNDRRPRVGHGRPRGAEGVGRAERAAVRVLSGRAADERRRADRSKPESHGRRHRRGDAGESLPLRHLRPHSSGGEARGGDPPGGAGMNTRRPGPTESNPLTFDGQLSRRQFLWVGAALGGGLLVQVACRGRAEAEVSQAGRSEPSEPSNFIRIAPDDTVFVTIPKSELGQGVRTMLAAFVAEELDADWSKVRPEAASYDERLGSQGTGGSGSVLDTHSRLRVAGATMRQMLVAAAAQQLGVPASELTTKDSRVIHAASNRSVGYGALADAASKVAVPTNVRLRKPAEWRLLGRDGIKGLDVQDIIHGRAKYGIDTRRDGMLFASVERATVFGATVKSFDPSGALKVPGVKQVVEVKGELRDAGIHAGVAVIATNTWAAMQGRQALKVTWDPGPHANESSASYTAFMRDAVSKPGKEQVNRIGDPDGVLAKATDVVRADYEFPFLAHATMEPQNCTAQFANGMMELWSPTQ